MNPVKQITEDQLGEWKNNGYPDAKIHNFRCPPGLDGCEDQQAVVSQHEGEAQIVRVPWKPTEEEMVMLAAGGSIWLSCVGSLPPHSLEVQ